MKSKYPLISYNAFEPTWSLTYYPFVETESPILSVRRIIESMKRKKKSELVLTALLHGPTLLLQLVLLY